MIFAIFMSVFIIIFSFIIHIVVKLDSLSNTTESERLIQLLMLFLVPGCLFWTIFIACFICYIFNLKG